MSSVSAAQVGVVIRVHNMARYLAASMRSVLDQTNPPGRIVVVDDGSTDGSGEVADRQAAESEIVEVIHQARSGPGGALNAGLERLATPLVAFQDADDLWPAVRIATMLRHLQMRPTVDGVMGRVQHFASEDLSPEEAARFSIPVDPQPGAALPSLLIRREAIDRVGPFEESLRAGEYLDWHHRAMAAGIVIEPIDDVVLERRVHLTNTTRSSVARRDYLRVARHAIARRRDGESRTENRSDS